MILLKPGQLVQDSDEILVSATSIQAKTKRNFSPKIIEQLETEEYFEERLVIDKLEVRKQLLERYHDSRVAGHYGIGKTLELVTRNYYWKGMEKDVRQWVTTCKACQLNKALSLIHI